MGLFRRLSTTLARKFQRRADSNDPYIKASSTDNPFLTEFGSGFVYHTFETAMFATWMMVNDYDEYLPDTLENIVLGMDSKIGDAEDPLQSCRGYVYEVLRLAQSVLATSTDAYTMAILTSDNETELTEALSYVARAFLSAVIEGNDGEAMTIAETYCTANEGEAEGVATYLMFIVTTLTLITREWFVQTFPEFSGDNDGGENEDVEVNE